MREALGFVLIAVGLFWAVPSIWHMLRHRTSTGVSLSSQVLYLNLASSWTVYGAVTSSAVLLTSGITDVLCAIGLTVAVVRTSGFTVRDFVPAVVFASLMAVMVVGGLSAFVVAFSAVLTLRWTPQILATVSVMRRAVPASGVSVTGAGWGLAMCAGWTVWGAWPLIFGTDDLIDWPNIVWGLTGVISFVLQLLSVRPKAGGPPVS